MFCFLFSSPPDDDCSVTVQLVAIVIILVYNYIERESSQDIKKKKITRDFVIGESTIEREASQQTLISP